MDPEDSLSGKNLPLWIKDDFTSRIMPTVLEHFGGQEDPWKLDFDKPVKAKPVKASTSTNHPPDEIGIIDIVQKLISELLPRKKYQLASDNIIVRVVSLDVTCMAVFIANLCTYSRPGSMFSIGGVPFWIAHSRPRLPCMRNSKHSIRRQRSVMLQTGRMARWISTPASACGKHHLLTR